MWMTIDKSVALNLSQAIRIYCTPFSGRHMIKAEFADSTVTLHIFDTADDAHNYIEKLVDELNGKSQPKLGYAFTWLSAIEKLPPDKKSEFDKIAQIWLNSLGEPETCIADDSQYYKLAENEDEVIFAPKPKKIADDGIEW